MTDRNRIAILVAGAAMAAAAATSAAIAAEKIVYTYDARGRLVKVERSEGVNNGVVTQYGFDKADNRIVKTTTGSPNPPPP